MEAEAESSSDAVVAAAVVEEPHTDLRLMVVQVPVEAAPSSSFLATH